eukprot:CAMPEP_0197850448 /NCGR_PEP_ID=MMETSP1438-20131217/15369_1 /TAXON_ID=1461541 /ORGANISM="Pterosperma sp., Strain CCMP1384" /LENGTH=53 /DNA_ID=CAMNT_0043463607 /DNA_START=42 /DNA_END=200 /DNA_ORIENTATION=-
MYGLCGTKKAEAEAEAEDEAEDEVAFDVSGLEFPFTSAATLAPSAPLDLASCL